MHIVGIATDKDGKEYYKVKNSWDDTNEKMGYIYVSKAFFRYKTIDIVINKAALPKNVSKMINAK
jgi:bleomycin hydrolase